MNVKSALSIELTISAIQPPNGPLVSRMIPPVLAPWCTVQIEIDPQTILSRPLKYAENVTEEGNYAKRRSLSSAAYRDNLFFYYAPVRRSILS